MSRFIEEIYHGKIDPQARSTKENKTGTLHKSKQTKTELSFVTAPFEIVVSLIILRTMARISGVPLCCILS